MLNLVHSMLINHSRNTTLSQHVPTSKNESSVLAFGRLKSLFTQTLEYLKQMFPNCAMQDNSKLFYVHGRHQEPLPLSWGKKKQKKRGGK